MEFMCKAIWPRVDMVVLAEKGREYFLITVKLSNK